MIDPNSMDPDARYNDKGQSVSTKWRNNWGANGYCSKAPTCTSYPRYCSECMMLNGKRTMYEEREGTA